MPVLRIRVAGRTLAVRSPVRLGIAPAYEAFRVARGSDIAVEVRPGPLPPLPAGALFRSGGTWTAHALGSRVVYAFRTTGPDTAPDRLLFVNRARTRAVLHVPPFRAGSPRPLGFPLDDLLFQHHLAAAGRLVVHCCGLVVDGAAVVFAGHSGAGKSTTARLWSRLDRRTLVLSDDRIVLARAARGFRAHGTPWHGEGRFAAAGSAPLAALFFLRHGARTRVTPVSVADAAARLFARTFPPPWDGSLIGRTLEECGRVAAAVPAYDLRFRPDASAVDAVRRTLAAG
ncbi:MAG: hypothetical protein ABW221_10185 [Vicinamibacteria bacterium]